MQANEIAQLQQLVQSQLLRSKQLKDSRLDVDSLANQVAAAQRQQSLQFVQQHHDQILNAHKLHQRQQRKRDKRTLTEFKLSSSLSALRIDPYSTPLPNSSISPSLFSGGGNSSTATTTATATATNYSDKNKKNNNDDGDNESIGSVLSSARSNKLSRNRSYSFELPSLSLVSQPLPPRDNALSPLHSQQIKHDVLQLNYNNNHDNDREKDLKSIKHGHGHIRKLLPPRRPQALTFSTSSLGSVDEHSEVVDQINQAFQQTFSNRSEAGSFSSGKLKKLSISPNQDYDKSRKLLNQFIDDTECKTTLPESFLSCVIITNNNIQRL
jgi:hypothetical protein